MSPLDSAQKIGPYRLNQVDHADKFEKNPVTKLFKEHVHLRILTILPMGTVTSFPMVAGAYSGFNTSII